MKHVDAGFHKCCTLLVLARQACHQKKGVNNKDGFDAKPIAKCFIERGMECQVCINNKELSTNREGIKRGGKTTTKLLLISIVGRL
jgi:hypothetical protein